RTRRRVASGSLALRRLRGVSQDPCDVVVCSGSVGVRGVELAAPGMLRGGTSRDPAGRNHIQYARGSGRRRLGFDPNVARPGNPLRGSASPRDTMRFSATSPLRLRGPLPPQRTSTPVTFQPAMGTLLLSLLPWALFVLWMPVLLRQRPRIAAYAPPTDGAAPLVSIIVPARNEAHNIAACVATLLDSAYPRREVIVVDDGSVDGTGDIARALAERSEGAVHVIDGAPLPAGWFGKPWACWQGYRAARGEVLLFVDADTRQEPELIGHAVGALEAERADLVTVLPRQRLRTFWERA